MENPEPATEYMSFGTYAKTTRADDVLNPFDLWGGESALEGEGFTFNDSDPATCEEPEG